MTLRAILLLALALTLTISAALLTGLLAYVFVKIFIDSLQYGRIIGGGMEDGFPFWISIVDFILAKWSYEAWKAWGRLRRASSKNSKSIALE